MSAINVTRVAVLSNPAPFLAPFEFEIEYECISGLQEDLQWKMIYVGSAESEKYDQVLDDILLGPVYPGQYKFKFEANAPDPSKLLQTDILGVTVILLTCSYKGKEFIRIGYYLNNEYEEEALREAPPEVPIVDKLTRSILASDPRVTRFPADFDNPPAETVTDMQEPAADGNVDINVSSGGWKEQSNGAMDVDSDAQAARVELGV